MPDLLDVAILLLGLLAGAWLTRDLRTVPAAGPGTETGSGTGAGARVSVVVPARDEEACLPTLLDSLRRLDPPAAEVVVVDDGSSDGTAAVARAGGARVLAAGEPPAGWTGKAWACEVGSRATDGEVLLFLDADTALAPDALPGLLAELHDHPGLVSVQPFHAVGPGHEQLAAYPNAVAVLGSGAFRSRPGVPLAFGPCLLARRRDHERVGGHGAVRGEVLDDVELGFAYARAGLPVRCLVGGRAVSMRSYPEGLGALGAGFTKNLAAGAGATAPGPGAGAVLWVWSHHVVAVGALHAVALAALGSGGGLGPLAAWAVAWGLVSLQLRGLLRRLGTFRWWTWALFPVPLVLLDVVLLRSLAHTVLRRSVTWRGREVRVGC